MSRVAVVTIDDQRVRVEVDGDELELPIGTRSLGARHIVSDPPLPEELTNAIGEVLDHVDDLTRELPGVVDVAAVQLVGEVPRTMAAVELGRTIDGSEFVLSRDAAEDVFRTLAIEAAVDRRHNPGLDPALVDSIVGGCCLVVGLFRGLQLDAATVLINSGAHPPS